MPQTKLLPVEDLSLDLKNFRTVPQTGEVHAIHSMISMNPDWFWALTDSLLTDGYHPTENIIVLKSDGKGSAFTVKEGNRRIAALKLILGYVKKNALGIPSSLEQKIADLSPEWKLSNEKVPCAVYGAGEADIVDRIVTLTHGKGEKAGRDRWNAVARSRHNRDKNGQSEPALDLLEKYLKNGRNSTGMQTERWAAIYPLSVLEEAMKKLAPRCECSSSRELVEKYPGKTKFRTEIEDVLKDIGMEILTFELIRDKSQDHFATRYGLSLPTTTPSGQAAAQPPLSNVASGPQRGISEALHAPSLASPIQGLQGANPSAAVAHPKIKAVAIADPKSVMRTLRQFTPRGVNREKVVTLLVEMKQLKIQQHPHAFCFLLRSMFEISAKAYCDDHMKQGGPKYLKKDGNEKSLGDILREVAQHLTQNGVGKAMQKRLHGATAELTKTSGILSVTSMNQLIHNPKFSITEHEICSMFGNIFPLLEEMNR
jgi:hypothetical protein